jgi:hypothetical protein
VGCAVGSFSIGVTPDVCELYRRGSSLRSALGP